MLNYMASYPALGDIGQEYILEEQYKTLFGYPNGKVNLSLSSEVPGTSRPFILQNQIYSQEIPITPPILDASGSTSIGVNTYHYQYSTLYPYLEKYTEVKLSNNYLSKSSEATGSGALTWWFIESGKTDNRENQLKYNILSPGVPNNLDPNGNYTPTLYIAKDDTSAKQEYGFGNGNYPWTYNVNSGIVLFTGSYKYSGTGTPSNNTPDSTNIITFTFWRYNGTFGTPSATTYWEAITTPINGIKYGALSVENNVTNTGSIYTQNIKANDTTANVNLYTNLTTGSLSIGSTGTNCQINSKTTFISNFDIFNPNQSKTATISYLDGSALSFSNPQSNAGFYFTNTNGNDNLVTFTTTGSTFNTDLQINSDLYVSNSNVRLYSSNLYCGGEIRCQKLLANDDETLLEQLLYTNLGSTGKLTIGSTGTNSTFNSALVVGGTATFNNGATFNTVIPTTSIQASSENELVNYTTLTSQGYTTLSAVQGNDNTFTLTNTFTGNLVSTTGLIVEDSSLQFNKGEKYINSYLIESGELTFQPYFGGCSYNFICTNASNSEIKSIYFKFDKTTIQTALEVGGTATFNTYVPECSVGATSGNQLTNKTYVDSKIGGVTTNQILNFSPTEVTNIKKSIIYRKNTTITSSSILARLDNPPTIPQVYTFGKKINNLWVAVGQGNGSGTANYGVIAYSNNGVNWATGTIASISGFYFLNDVAWNGKIWVAVGLISTLKSIIYSYNGIDWETITTSPLPAGYGVAWNETMWVAVGSSSINQTIAYSYDGTSWTGVTGQFYVLGNGVAWNGQMWVAVGDGTNNIAYSYNGTSWKGIIWTDTNVKPFTTGNGVAWNGQMWVAVGDGTNSIAYSYDGTSWTGIAGPFSAGKGVSWNGTMWVAVGSGTYTIAYSANGKNWTASNNNPFSSYGIGIAFNSARPNTIVNPLFVAGGSKIGYSDDGITWSASDNGNSVFDTNSNGVHCVATNGIMWVAGAEYPSTRLGYSFNGRYWSASDNGNIIFSNVYGVAWNGSMWVAVGNGSNTIAWSNDGISWTGLGTTYIDAIGHAVASSGTRWVAVGNGTNKVVYSDDGISWTDTNGSSLFVTCWCVASNGTMWVVGGDGGGNTMAWSNDGISWTGVGNIFRTQCRGVAWNGQMWVAVGYSDTTGYSPTDYEVIAYSSDGIIWDTDTNGSSIFDNLVYSVAWNGNVWVAVGQGLNQTPGKVGYSYDGKTWYASASGSSIFTSVYGVGAIKNVNIPGGSIVLSAGDQLDVVCDSYYNTGFTNFSISIDA